MSSCRATNAKPRLSPTFAVTRQWNTAAYWARISLYPALREVARRHGYALAVHGSLERDIDYLAVPWTETATDPFELVRDLALATEAIMGWMRWGGNWTPDLDMDPPPGSFPNPERKPHGRLAWLLLLSGTYVDLSVVPPRR